MYEPNGPDRMQQASRHCCECREFGMSTISEIATQHSVLTPRNQAPQTGAVIGASMLGDERVLTNPAQHRRGEVQQGVDPGVIHQENSPAALQVVSCRLNVACTMSLTDERVHAASDAIDHTQAEAILHQVGQPDAPEGVRVACASDQNRVDRRVRNHKAKEEHDGEPHFKDCRQEFQTSHLALLCRHSFRCIVVLCRHGYRRLSLHCRHGYLRKQR
mmetsp:Transcript_57382/g.145686  ORF Transcript_57382/g.145686 Transcript_57382/m.145686 type:complete len:217 (-) Transcript_57382:98-748(-)